MSTNKTQSIWNQHYTKTKSRLTFPDENLVRILSKLNSYPLSKKVALDLGCGSGRHTILLESMGWETIGLDYSHESIQILKEISPNTKSVVCDCTPYPFENEYFQLVVAWGVLHYNSDLEIKSLLKEILRILPPGGFFVGTVRAESDTLLNPNQNNQINLIDLKGGYVQLFNESRLKNILKDFTDIKIGYMERTLLGELDKKIAHFFFQAMKPE